MSENVIQFPNINENIINREEIEARKLMMQHYHVQEIVETLLPMIFTQLSLGGFDFDEELDIKDTAFIVEALRSVLCKKKGLSHPFHEIIENVFNVTEPGVLTVVDKLNVDLSKIDDLDMETNIGL